MFKKFKSYIPILVAMLIAVLFTFLFYLQFPDFFQVPDKLYTGTITLFVGLFVVWLYIRQKEDFKRDTSAALLMEIRYAERIISDIQKNLPKFDPWTTILPSDSWVKYNYLFTDDLDQDELDLINGFYNDCKLIEKGASQLDVGKQLESKANCIQAVLADFAKDNQDKAAYEKKKMAFLKLFASVDGESYTFPPAGPQERIVATLNRIKFISTSTAGGKLKKIAGQAKGY